MGCVVNVGEIDPLASYLKHMVSLDPKNLRDYFAAMALTAILSDFGDDCTGYRAAIAARAYMIADAMLAEREKSPCRV